ncbi:type I restriction-modification enzyme R subunit C-terminal domain-containing protein [Methanothermococcus okinawensis]|uniref:type I restriction-modification enzyme R subunit C-terminal domain-containing protein n=1 Tax=Methanothermococcus okinawensis TaxID=155863 RepID=UPI0001E30443|nr:type I restriction-modification enzyme R subunit C-terminal domain-containing protein [Methanothermococcus okinawensis]
MKDLKKIHYPKKSGYFELNGLPSNSFLPLTISKEGYKTLKKKINLNDLKEIENPIFELKPIKKKPKTITVKGINVEIAEEIDIEFDGNKISFAEYKQYTKEHILKEVHTTEDLKNLWINDNLRREFLNKLEEKKIDIELIKKLENKLDYDTFDIIAHLVFDAPLLTKDERVNYFINSHIHHINKYGDDIREIAFSLLEKYKKGGIENISTNALKTPDMKRKNAITKLKNIFGLKIPNFLGYIKKHIYDNEIYTKAKIR